jgi:hypothetical protein
LRLQVMGHLHWLPGQVEFHTVQAQRVRVFLISGTGAGKTAVCSFPFSPQSPRGKFCAVTSTLDRTDGSRWSGQRQLDGGSIWVLDLMIGMWRMRCSVPWREAAEHPNGSWSPLSRIWTTGPRAMSSEAARSADCWAWPWRA